MTTTANKSSGSSEAPDKISRRAWIIGSIIALVAGTAFTWTSIHQNDVNARAQVVEDKKMAMEGYSNPVTITDYLAAMGYDMSRPIPVTVGISGGGTSTSVDCNLTIVCNGNEGDKNATTPVVFLVTFHVGDQTIRLGVPGSSIHNTAEPGHPTLILSDQPLSYHSHTASCHGNWFDDGTTCEWFDQDAINPKVMADLQGMSLYDLFAKYTVGINAADADVPTGAVVAN